MYPLSTMIEVFQAQKDVPLAPFSTLRVGGLAQYLVQPNSLAEIAQIQLFCKEHQISWHLLSGGSNTLFSDSGFKGLVIKLGPAFDTIEHKEGKLLVGARASFAKVTKTAVGLGWSKALGWCGTPGLIGGAIRMNAGTRMGEIKDGILSVTGIKDGQVITFQKGEIEFSYRKNSLPKDFIVCNATLGVPDDAIEPKDELMHKVNLYREQRRKTQPAINSLGSFFKNPTPFFAGQLIEQCGLKGFSYKDAQISPTHANFIINNNQALAKDILYVAALAQKAVLEQTGILLEPEVRLVGEFLENPLIS